MKKLLTFFLAIALISGILSQVTIAGYNGGYGSISGSAGGGPATSMTIGTTTVSGGTNGNCLTISAGALGNGACGGVATSIVVATTTVGSGTNGYLLYNNSGTLGNEAVSGLSIGWGQLTGTPTTLSGYGITDSFNSSVPTPIGATTPNTGAFTTLSASSTVSGSGFSTYLASPPAIGGSSAAAGTFTSLTGTSVTDSGLTSGRMPFATTNGLLTDNSALTYNSGTNTVSTTNLTVTGTCTGCASGASQVPVIQTVMYGPSDSNGAPTFLPASTTGLNFTTQNISGTYPLTVTSVNGFSASGYNNSVGVQSSNFTFTSLPNSTTSYLYVTVSGGALTTGSTTTAPSYIQAGSAPVTNGQYTYVIADAKMYLGNGSTAPQVNVVFVGEAVASGGNITSSVNYAYNGFYRSPNTAVPNTNTLTTFSHNIGVKEVISYSLLVNTTAELSYSVGDYAYGMGYNGSVSTTYNGIALSSRNAVIQYMDGGMPRVINRTTPGQIAAITQANWKIIIFAKRQW